MSLRDAERDFKERKDARRAEDLDGLLVVAHLLTSVVSMSVSATRRAVSSCDSIRLRGARCEAGNAAIPSTGNSDNLQKARWNPLGI